MDFLVYINRFSVALVLSIFFGNGAALAGVKDDFARAKQLFDSGDYKTATSAWTSLAEQGHSQSQVMLGYAYKNGIGVVENDKTAVGWYTKAAEQGDSYAQFKLGSAYTNGEGVLDNYQSAVKWFNLAAKQGFGNAQYMLAINYFNGRGVRKDNKRAYMWCSLAIYNGTQLATKIKGPIAEKMKPYQISEAQEMSRLCLASNYQTC